MKNMKKFAIVENGTVKSFIVSINEGLANEILNKLKLDEISSCSFILPYDKAQADYEINEKKCAIYSIEHSFTMKIIDSIETLNNFKFYEINKYSEYYDGNGMCVSECILNNGKCVSICDNIYIDADSDDIYESVDIIKRKSQYVDYIYSYGLIKI